MAQPTTPAAGSGHGEKTAGQLAVVLSAPQGWGKTRNAEALRTEFGCSSIVDDWTPGPGLRLHALHLTNADIPEASSSGVLIVRRGWKGGAA